MSYTLKTRAEYNSVEISFDSKPEKHVLDSLKSNGWRWNHSTAVWYKRNITKADAKAVLENAKPAAAKPAAAKAAKPAAKAAAAKKAKKTTVKPCSTDEMLFRLADLMCETNKLLSVLAGLK